MSTVRDKINVSNAPESLKKLLRSLLVESTTEPTLGAGVPAHSSVTMRDVGVGPLHKTILTCTNTPVTITDQANVVQYGGVQVFDFPQGLTVVLGAVVSGAFTGGVTGTITNTFAGGVALGTVTATTGTTLTSTEADIMPEVDVAAATLKVATIDAVSVAAALTESGARWFDGTATAKSMFLNFVIDDEATHTSGSGKFTGTISFAWMNLGDN